MEADANHKKYSRFGFREVWHLGYKLPLKEKFLILPLTAHCKVTIALIHSAESETGLTRFCDLIGEYLYMAHQVWKYGFDFAKSHTA